MVNDTSTLNGALTELGELMADNLVTMGVTDADASDGLTTLANKILDVPQGGSCIAIDLVSDKSILSYADTETATLTATVTENGVAKSGESVQFYIDDVAWGSPITTNSSGIASKTYNSTGSGDVTFKASVGMIVSETYEIEDCTKYDSNTYSANATLNYTLPSTFTIEYESYITQTSNNSCFIRVGENDGKAMLTGKVGSGDSQYKIYARKSSSGTGDLITTGDSITVGNDWQENIITWNGTTYSYKGMSVTNLNTISLDKLVSFATWKSGTSSGRVRNIKVKPL